MKNHNDILNSLNETINNSHYSYPEYRERIGSPIKPVEREFINGPLEDLDGNITDSSNHVISSSEASLIKGRMIYAEACEDTSRLSDDDARELASASSEFNPYATISDLAYGDESDGSFKIGNNLRGGSDDSNVRR